MSKGPRREVAELIALHRRERGMQEVFVEGNEDQGFFREFLVAFEFRDVGVYPIDTVDVPTELVLKLGLPDGNKGRVVALAALLEGQVSCSDLVCVADTDLDVLLERQLQYSLLLYTDYSSLELYVLNFAALRKLLTAIAPGLQKTPEQVIDELAVLMRDSFLIRAAAEQLGFALRYPDRHSDYCVHNRKLNTIWFRTDDYIRSCIRECAAPQAEHRLKEAVETLRQITINEPRLLMHGHDTVDTLVWYIRQQGFNTYHPETMMRMIRGMIDFKIVADEPLFIELLRRLRSGQT